MKVLGIETSTAVCGASLFDGTVRSEHALEAPQIHSEKLITLIAGTLEAAGVRSSDLDAVAVSIGPGSFTGLRIGLSVAKGLAYAADLPLVAVPTLESLAERCIGEGLAPEGRCILSLIDARRNELYAALYRVEGGLPVETVPPKAVATDGIEGMIGSETGIVVMGDGAEKFGEFCRLSPAGFSARFVVPQRSRRLCSASAVARAGARRFMMGERADVSALEPMYVKEFYTLVKTQHSPVE